MEQSITINYSEYIQGDTGLNPDTALRVYGARKALYATRFENMGYLPRTEQNSSLGFARVPLCTSLANLMRGLTFTKFVALVKKI